MSILYCSIPHFPVALARRNQPALADRPLVLLGPEGRVFDASAEAAACGVRAGLTSRMAQVRCPEARLLDTDVAGCREAFETLLQVLERFSESVEPHGWGAAYVDLGDVARDRGFAKRPVRRCAPDAGAKRSRGVAKHPRNAHRGTRCEGSRGKAISLCSESGRAVREALGDALEPALGWDTSKFTAQAAARYTRPGHLLAVDAAHEQDFLNPLPVVLLPLPRETVQRLYFLGLRTLGQYAALPAAAVWQQFGRAGRRAHRYARGEDDRPVVPRHKAPVLTAEHTFEVPAVTQDRLLAALRRAVDPLLAELQAKLQACGQVRLLVRFDDGSAEERTRTFLFPSTKAAHIECALSDMLGRLHRPPRSLPRPRRSMSTLGARWPTGVISVSVSLEQIQEAVMEQLTFLSEREDAPDGVVAVQRYLSTRFGASRLWRAALAQPGAPLPEWRVSWYQEA
jgi:nucleotidyltransferase/DNA polymerase involved in DNA repair